MEQLLKDKIISMANYIMQILNSNIFVIMSWGFCNNIPYINKKTGEYGLRFKVNGFIHSGWVNVGYDNGTDTFTIYLLNNENKLVKKIEMVYFDTLLETIDNEVEHCSNYNEKVKEYLNK